MGCEVGFVDVVVAVSLVAHVFVVGFDDIVVVVVVFAVDVATVSEVVDVEDAPVVFTELLQTRQ